MGQGSPRKTSERGSGGGLAEGEGKACYHLLVKGKQEHHPDVGQRVGLCLVRSLPALMSEGFVGPLPRSDWEW